MKWFGLTVTIKQNCTLETSLNNFTNVRFEHERRQVNGRDFDIGQEPTELQGAVTCIWSWAPVNAI